MFWTEWRPTCKRLSNAQPNGDQPAKDSLTLKDV